MGYNDHREKYKKEVAISGSGGHGFLSGVTIDSEEWIRKMTERFNRGVSTAAVINVNCPPNILYNVIRNSDQKTYQFCLPGFTVNDIDFCYIEDGVFCIRLNKNCDEVFTDQNTLVVGFDYTKPISFSIKLDEYSELLYNKFENGLISLTFRKPVIEKKRESIVF